MSSKIQFHQAALENCGEATGTVVVIDVLRAFTTSAYAFAAGAKGIALVQTVADAFALKSGYPDALLMGEERGLPIDGFDYGNSPSAFVTQKLDGCKMIQRTSAGTQGVVQSVNADVLLASSLCCASATARYLQSLTPERITFVITGSHTVDQGDEDRACADAIESLLKGEKLDKQAITERVRDSAAARKFLDPTEVAFPIFDLECALAIDRFDFAMPVKRRDDGLWMQVLA